MAVYSIKYYYVELWWHVKDIYTDIETQIVTGDIVVANTPDSAMLNAINLHIGAKADWYAEKETVKVECRQCRLTKKPF